ncbi:MAG: LptF/LptG family permease, partial [Muribaculaceae bacterium]|nr:LptF/LptG family permease [Muribaculaceae bacterium]
MRCRICNIFKRKAKDISSPAIQSTEETSVIDVPQITEDGIVIDDTIIPNSNIEQTVNQDAPSDTTDNNKPNVEKTPLKDKVFRFLRLKKLDQYILKKFLGTYFFAILLFLAIVVMFDINEKLDAFLSAPLKETVFDYFFNFLPYFANQFSPLFVFISVIFFTSKMAGNSEIIAILSSGVSFRRLLRPYMIGATVIAAITFVMSNYIIPPTNVDRINYTNKYVKNKKVDIGTNIQLMVEPGVIAYMARYDAPSKMSYRFSLDKFEGKKLVSRLTAQSASYDTLYNWKIRDYMIRDFNGMKESVRRGSSMDTIIPIEPRDFIISKNDQETLTTP